MRSSRSLSACLLVAVALAPLIGADPASAGKKARKSAESTGRVDEKAMGELMGPFKFGMSKDEVLGVLRRDIDARYQEKLEATTDVYVQDRLRRDRAAEIDAIKASYLEFKGGKTGWDVSIIDDQFGRNTGEAMMQQWESERDQRRFFFFFEGRLYKMFIALSSKMLKDDQKNFTFFQQLMESRYGRGKVEMRVESSGDKVPERITWRSPRYTVIGLDRFDFHGSFCLVISDPRVEKQVLAVRAERNPPARKGNPLIKAMLEQPGENTDDLGSANRNAVDEAIKRR